MEEATKTKSSVISFPELPRPTHSNGGGGDMESRIAKLESDVNHIQNDIKDIKSDVREIKKDAKTDFRILFGALITVALGLAGLMAKGFHWF
ncbi:hypothetical protein [Pantoea sp. C2G6]|uniref:hypothetical protein n=1 Tax=Pantoea sp. C2G6 TaxID=3243084 RepID=UPI003EDA95B6